MKIQCDMCEKEAVMFCEADEAALCQECDKRVHYANKLATKHKRFSLLLPSSVKDAPLCDICQDKRAFMFCKEDRSILCKECDIPIHVANEHTSKHNRYLLTGAKLSASIASYPDVFPDTFEPKFENTTSFTKSNTCDNAMFNQHVTATTTASIMNYNQTSEEGSTSTVHTMPEYLMDALPEWKFEDLFASSSTSHDLYY